MRLFDLSQMTEESQGGKHLTGEEGIPAFDFVSFFFRFHLLVRLYHQPRMEMGEADLKDLLGVPSSELQLAYR